MLTFVLYWQFRRLLYLRSQSTPCPRRDRRRDVRRLPAGARRPATWADPRAMTSHEAGRRAAGRGGRRHRERPGRYPTTRRPARTRSPRRRLLTGPSLRYTPRQRGEIVPVRRDRPGEAGSGRHESSRRDVMDYRRALPVAVLAISVTIFAGAAHALRARPAPPRNRRLHPARHADDGRQRVGGRAVTPGRTVAGAGHPLHPPRAHGVPDPDAAGRRLPRPAPHPSPPPSRPRRPACSRRDDRNPDGSPRSGPHRAPDRHCRRRQADGDATPMRQRDPGRRGPPPRSGPAIGSPRRPSR